MKDATEVEDEVQQPKVIDPQATRKKGATGEPVPGVPVVLADGLTWYLACPRVRYLPALPPEPDLREPVDINADPEASPVGIIVTLSYRRPIQYRLDQLRKRIEADAHEVPIVEIFGLALGLLRECHDLTFPEACALLECDKAGLDALIKALKTAISGEDPETTTT